MKRLLLLVSLLVICMLLNAQQNLKIKGHSAANKSNQENPLNPSNHGPKCASDLVLQQSINRYPSYQTNIKKANDLLNQEVNRRLSTRLQKRPFAESVLPVNIPIVFHIVTTNPALITDAMVQWQVDKLNSDFSGLNADSTNLSPMFPYNLRGHSTIRFVLAKKDPGNNLTTGIERRCSNTVFTADERDPIKLATEGGLDAWNPEKYVNIWVGNTNASGLLGYSSYPYTVAGYNEPPAIFHGVTIKKEAFGNNISTYPFNRGRTLVHEMGHFFGLFHIFEGGCADLDFSFAGFDAGNTDDTPPQLTATGYGVPGENSCPSGNTNSGCTNTPSGRLYQNYMDYTDDPCMSMFTANQVVRMETALDLFKPTLKTSDAGSMPISFVKDVEVLATIGPNVGNPAFMDCNSVISPLHYCSNGTAYSIAPILKFRNAGSSAISSLEVWYKVGEEVPVLNKSFLFTAPVVSYEIQSIQLSPISLTNGEHTVKIFTRLPDNQEDEKAGNDTIQLSLTIELPSILPIAESFETASFPPAGWKLVNANADTYTWQRIEGAAKTGHASVFMNFFDYSQPGRVDDLLSPAIDIAFADSILLDFERAYKQFDSSVKDFSDTLEILVSEDCGASFKTVWKHGGADLASVPGETGLFSWSPADGDWVPTSINLRPLVSKSAGSLRVIFRGKNGYGQNLFLDDITLKTVVKPIRDAGIVSVAEPLLRECSGIFRPSVIIENLGEDTLRKLMVKYSIDGGKTDTLFWTGKLKKFQEEKVSFNQVTVTGKGVHQLLFSIESPNDLTDQHTANDTIIHRLMIFDAVQAPVKEGFENPVFPPAGWDISGVDQPFKWQRTAGASYELAASAWVNNRVNTRKGSREELYSPIIKIDEMDSLLVTFDLAHVTEQYPGTGKPTDTLQVLLTTDCGKTFTSVYKKWGYDLNTLKEAYPGSSTRDSVGFQPNLKSQWRTDTMNITKALGVSRQFQLVFRNINNNDNNIFIDNIRVNPVILPDELKNKGYQVMPNPSRGVFYIRHYLPPMNLEGIQVVNARGQLILTKRYKGNALSAIPVDLTSQAAGVYTVRLIYSNKVITEKIIRIP